jgi:hypothetical protein
LALILAASTVLGGIGTVLLLPAGAALSLMLRRISRRRAASEQDAILLLLTAVAMAGLCGPSGLKAWAFAGVALAAAVMVKAAQSCSRSPQRQTWQIWGMSAGLCAAIAFATQDRMGLPAPLGLLMPLAAGLLYGAAAGASARILSRRTAQSASAMAPFMTAVTEMVLGGAAHLYQLAAAVLLAAVLAASSRYAPARRKAVDPAPNAWPAGWPQWP